MSVSDFEIDLTLFIRGNKQHQEIDLSFPAIKTDQIELLSSSTGSLNLEKLEQDVLAEFSITITTRIECERCLDRVEKDSTLVFKRIYTDNPDEEDPDEKNFPENLKINMLEEIIEEYVTQSDFKQLCKESCEGLEKK